MGYYVRRRNGEEVRFEDDVPEAEALARIRQMDDPESVNESFLGDAGDALSGLGISGLLSAAGGLADYMPGSPALINRLAGIPTAGEEAARIGREHRDRELETLTPETAEAMNREGWDQINPRNVAMQGIGSIPSMLPSMGAGFAARAAGASPNVAAWAASGMEGAQGMGGVADSIDEGIRDIAAMDPDTFINSEYGQQALRDTNGNYARAVEVAAQRAKGIAPLVAGIVTAGVGRFGGLNVFESAGRQQMARAILTGAIREGAEEFAQSGAEGIATNVDIANVDEGRNPLEGVPEQAVMGAITAAPMGGGFSAVQQIGERMGPQDDGLMGDDDFAPGPGPGGGGGGASPLTDTSDAEYAEFDELGENQIPLNRQRQIAGPGPDIGDAEAQTDDPLAQAQKYAEQAPEDDAFNDSSSAEEDDAMRAEVVRGLASELSRAGSEVPPVPSGATRTFEPVPLFGLGVRFGEDEDNFAHQIYKRAIAERRSPADTQTFQAYSELSEGLYPDASMEGQEPTGFGLRVVDRGPDGEIIGLSHVVTPAASLDEAAALARAQSGNKVTDDLPATPAPDSAVPEPTVSVGSVAEEPVRKKRPVRARDFVDGLITGQVRGASIADGAFELLMGTEGHAAETGTDTARYAQLARSGDVEITSAPATNGDGAHINIRVTPDAKPANVKQAIAVYQRAIREGLTPSVGLHTAENPQGVVLSDHALALKTLRDIAQGNLSTVAAPESVPDTVQATEQTKESPPAQPDNAVIGLAVPGKVIPNVPSNIGSVYRDKGYDGLKQTLGKANVLQIKSAAKRFGIKLPAKGSRDDIIDLLAKHFESNVRFNPKPGTILRPGRGLPSGEAKPVAKTSSGQPGTQSQTRDPREAGEKAFAAGTKPESIKAKSKELYPDSPKDAHRMVQAYEGAHRTAKHEAREKELQKLPPKKVIVFEEEDEVSGSRNLNELKAELKRLNKIAEDDEDSYNAAVRATKFTREEIATIEGAIQAGDKQAWNLRDVLSDVRRKPKASVQQEKAKVEKKAEAKKEGVARSKKSREMTDTYLAASIAKGQPGIDAAIKAVRDYVEVQRGKGKVAAGAWTIAREEALVAKVERYFGQEPRGMSVRKPGSGYAAGKTPGDLNPLQLFSQAERQARTFPEESSTRMHMVKWLERRVRKSELKFIDMDEFLKGGKTGNPLEDRATKQELVDYINDRKLKLTVSYAYGRVGDTMAYPTDGGRAAEVGPDFAAKFSRFTQEGYDSDEVAPIASYGEYTLLGDKAERHNLIEVGIVIQPGQPGSDGAFSHIGPKGTIAAFIASDLPIEFEGEQINAFAMHQGQSDYHDAKPEQYVNKKDRAGRLARMRESIEAELKKIGRPYRINDFGIFTSYARGSYSSFDNEPDAIYSSIGGSFGRPDVGGRGEPTIPPAVLRMNGEYERFLNSGSQERDIDAPYRETSPELMFRVAFMMAISSGHDALVWPTADTVRMYPGHSTYKGDFYDKRLPLYAKSWLKEFGAKVTKQPYEANIIGDNESEWFEEVEDPRTFDEIIDGDMDNEAIDLRSDIISGNRDIITDVDKEADVNGFLRDLAGALEENHGRWADRLDMAGHVGGPNRFNVTAERNGRKEAKDIAKDYTGDWLEDRDQPMLSVDELQEIAKQFADRYFDRFIEVLDNAVDIAMTAAKGEVRKPKQAEIYVMPITDEMREAFRETGAPMFAVKPYTQASLRGVTNRVASGSYTDSDVAIVRSIIEKMNADWKSVTEAEREVHDAALITTRNNKAGKMLNPDAYKNASTPWDDLLDSGRSAVKPEWAPPRKGKGKDAPLDPKWVREMADALKAAAACAASSAGAAALPAGAVAEIVAGTGLGLAAATPLAIGGASLYASQVPNTRPDAIPFSRVVLDDEGFVDEAQPIEEQEQRPYRAYMDSTEPSIVDNSEVGDRLIGALDLPERKEIARSNDPRRGSK